VGEQDRARAEARDAAAPVEPAVDHEPLSPAPHQQRRVTTVARGSLANLAPGSQKCEIEPAASVLHRVRIEPAPASVASR
jgi:hypothetical protein